MKKDEYKDAIEYEKLTQHIYQCILNRDGYQNINVMHNTSITGKSSVNHQVDVFWELKIANITHRVLVECKNYSSAISLEKIRNFHAVLLDAGNCLGIMVTQVGYQSGVQEYAKFYGINLKLLRKPTNEDWQGKMKDMIVSFNYKSIDDTEENPVKMTMTLLPVDKNQQEIFKTLVDKKYIRLPVGPDMIMLDKKQLPITDEMKYWLPRKLNILDKKAGGPYKDKINLDDHYLNVDCENGSKFFVKVIDLNIEYYVKEYDGGQIAFLGEEAVDVILRDIKNSEFEFIKHKSY